MSTKYVGLLGNPNCGKTSLFNLLTNSHYQVGNWPGVTVEKKSGYFFIDDQCFELADLPGIYSLSHYEDETALDEKVALDALMSKQFDLIINIVDACNLERNLYLTLQLLELGIPTILAINMTDLAMKKGIQLNFDKLAKHFGNIPLVSLDCLNKKGIEELKKLVKSNTAVPEFKAFNYSSSEVKYVIDDFQKIFQSKNCLFSRYSAISLLEGNNEYYQLLSDEEKTLFIHQKTQLEFKTGHELDILIADMRYQTAHDICFDSISEIEAARSFSYWLDRIVLNKFLGPPIFLLVMYCMFVFAINIGGVFQDFFDITSLTLFVQGPAYLMQNAHVPSGIITIICEGIGRGLNTTFSFIPILASMYFFLALLEDSGYMVRAAFVIDRIMQFLGLPGKSFISMIIGFGCNVPAIMASRTLETKRDRALTVLMSPFMSCSARLTIFAVFCAAFFPHYSFNILFLLYLTGIACAILTGFILRKTILAGQTSPLVMEMPDYHRPIFRNIYSHAWQRLKNFLWRAGKIIVPLSAVLASLNVIHFSLGDDHNSLLATLSQKLTPLFYPLGIHQDNWPATVGLITGLMAKELVIATLNTLYTQIGHLIAPANNHFDFWHNIFFALKTIPYNIFHLVDAFQNPIAATVKDQTLTTGMYHQMQQHFDGPIGAFAYLLFILLYVPCISSVAVIAKEIGKKWMLFSLIWNTWLAYSISVMFYQIMTIKYHPYTSILWLVSLSIVFLVFLSFLYFRSKKRRRTTWHPTLRPT